MGRFLSSKPHREPPRPVPAPEAPPSAAIATPPTMPAAAPAIAAPDSQVNDPFRKFAFYAGLGFVFLRFTALLEVIASLTGVNTYLLYLTAPPAILGVFLTGGLKRTYRHRAAYIWTALFLWMVIGTPFSSWRGQSSWLVFFYLRDALSLMFIVGGLVVTWAEVRAVLYTIAASGLVNLITARLFMTHEGGRISVPVTGTIGNSNDLAAQLLLVLPFLLFLVFDPKRNIFLRAALVRSLGYGLLVILGTASRGALVGIAAAVLFAFWHISIRQRVALIILASVGVVMMAVVVPDSALARLSTLFGAQHEEAKESADSRWYLLQRSVTFTIQHPLFGVGLGQFGTFEGMTSVEQGITGNWHAAHNSFTQVSSECGIPALIFFVSGLGAALHVVNRTLKAARQKGNEEIARACFCYLTAMVGFIVALTFLSNAFRFYYSAMIGLAVALSCAAASQLAGNGAAPVPSPVPAAPPAGTVGVELRRIPPETFQ